MKQTIYKNALLFEQMTRLSKEGKREIVTDLLRTMSVRKLAEQINVPKSTIQLWKNPEPKTEKPINFNVFYKKLNETRPEDITDWGRLEQIKDRINELLRQK